jgi:hypothetical protein
VKISFELKVAVEFESTSEFSRLEVSASLKASYNLEFVTFKKKPGCCIPHPPLTPKPHTPVPHTPVPHTPVPTTPVPTTPVPTTPVPTTPVPTTPVPTTPVPTTPVPTTTTTTTAAPTTPRPTFGQVTETPRTPLPSPTCPKCNNTCVQSNLLHVSQICGMTLVNVNFQELGLVEFQSFCTSCLQTVLFTQTNSNCDQYTRLRTQLQTSCDICLARRSPGDCGRESLCQWSPSLNRCCLADHVVNENEATPTSTQTPATHPTDVTTTPIPTTHSTTLPSPPTDCYTRNVRAASTICGRDLLALDFAAMNYSDFRGMCASCLEAILFTQDGPCRKYDELQATLHVECDVCLGKRSADICERDARCYWNEHLNRCAINRPGTTAPSRDQCYNENLQVAADECGHPLVTTNFQNLAPGEFQSICTACLDVVISTHTVSGCASYTSLQQSLQIECHECNVLRSQNDCDGNVKCAWMPQSQRCGVFRREDLARETDASQCSSNNDVCSAAGLPSRTATSVIGMMTTSASTVIVMFLIAMTMTLLSL